MLRLERGIEAVVNIVKIRGNHGLNAIRVIEKQIKLDKSSALTQLNKKYEQAKNAYFAAINQTRMQILQEMPESEITLQS